MTRSPSATSLSRTATSSGAECVSIRLCGRCGRGDRCPAFVEQHLDRCLKDIVTGAGDAGGPLQVLSSASTTAV